MLLALVAAYLGYRVFIARRPAPEKRPSREAARRAAKRSKLSLGEPWHPVDETSQANAKPPLWHACVPEPCCATLVARCCVCQTLCRCCCRFVRAMCYVFVALVIGGAVLRFTLLKTSSVSHVA